MKWLYAHYRHAHNVFWSIYDKGWYDELRTRYHAGQPASFYDKVLFDWGAKQ